MIRAVRRAAVTTLLGAAVLTPAPAPAATPLPGVLVYSACSGYTGFTYEVAPDGTGQRFVANGAFSAVSRAGRVAVRTPDLQHITTFPLPDGRPGPTRTLDTPATFGISSPYLAWSPDGTQVAYVNGDEQVNGLNPGRLAVITDQTGASPSYSQIENPAHPGRGIGGTLDWYGGKLLTFQDQGGGLVDAGQNQALVEIPEGSTSASPVSATNYRGLYARYSRRGGLMYRNGNGMTIDGQDFPGLRDGTNTIRDFAMSPDGQYMAIIYARTPTVDDDTLKVVSLDGTDRRSLVTQATGTFCGLSWVGAPTDRLVQGVVKDRYSAPVSRITVTLTGTEDGAGAVNQTTRTDDQGAYAFTIRPGTYAVEASGDPDQENGGGLSALPADGGACSGTPSAARCDLGKLDGADGRADFTYTPCAAPDRRADGKPITNCPIIFVPGFLGSKIACDDGGSTSELWPNIPGVPKWSTMLLAPDGQSNEQGSGACTASAHPVPGKEGVVGSVAGVTPIYRPAMDFLDELVGPRRWWALTFDWRKSPELAVPALDELVDQVLAETHAKRVVLYGHSMGGLVLREYVSDPAHVDKVLRLATAGTPYWGAPKSHFSFLEGDTDSPVRGALDYVTVSSDLQRLTQNLQGLFFLHPSPRYLTWLSLARGAGPLVAQDRAGTLRWISALGGNAGLLDRAYAWHDLRDGFPDTPIDYEVMVGAGVPTTTHIGVRRYGGLGDVAEVSYGSGDGTVPLRSATQGASDGAIVGKEVGIHYVCGVSHVPLPGALATTRRLRNFLRDGRAVPDAEGDNCPYTGTELSTYEVDLAAGNVLVEWPQPPASASSARHRAAARAAGAMTRLTLDQAEARGLVQTFTFHGKTTFVTDRRHPVSIVLSGKDLALEVRTIASTGDGRPVAYRVAKGPVTLGATGGVTVGGKAVRATKRKAGGPRTRAIVTRRGKRYVVRLVARAPNGVGVTHYRIGTGVVTPYVRPLRLTAKDLRRLRFASIDAFGAVERARGVGRRR